MSRRKGMMVLATAILCFMAAVLWWQARHVDLYEDSELERPALGSGDTSVGDSAAAKRRE